MEAAWEYTHSCEQDETQENAIAVMITEQRTLRELNHHSAFEVRFAVDKLIDLLPHLADREVRQPLEVAWIGTQIHHEVMLPQLSLLP